jgi:uncharacterized protein
MIAVIRTLIALAAVLLFGLTAMPTLQAAPAVPALTGPVVDQAGVLAPADRDKLEALSRAARAEQSGQGVELQYLIVRSLDGEPIEDFSIHVAEAWKIGSRGKDNGILIVIAQEDRKVRIEVGGGLEGVLTDAQSGRIIRQTIAPAFRAGRYGDGLYDAGVQVLGAVGGLPHGIAAPPLGEQRPQGGSALGFVLGLLVMIVLLVALSRRGGRGLLAAVALGGLAGGRRGGGGLSSGGGGGGGGWGGGGGGFSGGGASGGW